MRRVFSQSFIDKLETTPRGKVCSCNITDALDIGLVSKGDCKALGAWWEAWSDFRGIVDGDELCDALEALKDLAEYPHPTGFNSPDVALPDLHVFSRVPLNEADLHPEEEVCSVRSAAHLSGYAHEEDLAAFQEDGYRPDAKPGSVDYANLLNAKPRKFRLRPKEGATITNPMAGDRAIFWFTRSSFFRQQMERCAPDGQPDLARDALGLSHIERNVPLSVVHLSAKLVEERDDVGRPTFADSGANARFLCRHDGDDGGDLDPWGRAIDLAELEGNSDLKVGLPERICGRVPPSQVIPGDEPSIVYQFLGHARVPRGESGPAEDKQFSDIVTLKRFDRGPMFGKSE